MTIKESMNNNSLGRRSLTLGAALAIAACGGGTSTGSVDVFSRTNPVAMYAGPLAAMASPTRRSAAATRAVDANSFLNWAESAYPSLFEAPQSNKTIDIWTYRFYPRTDIFLGVNTSGDVLGLVGRAGGAYEAIPLGKLMDFGCLVYPSDCATAPSVNVVQAWTNLLNADRTWETSGIGPSGQTIRFTMRAKPEAASTFELTGRSGQTTRQSTTLTIGGVVAGSSWELLHFDGTDLFGIEEDDGSCSTVPTLASPIPGSSPVGARGDFATSINFTTCTAQMPSSGSTSRSWSVESDAGTTLFCINEVQQVYGQGSSNQQVCFEATADGTLGAKARVTLYFSASTIFVARNY